MKKMGLQIVLALMMLWICGCSKPKLPDDPIVFQFISENKLNEDGDYAYLAYEDKVYVPYCPYEAEYLGGCIGYYDLPADKYTDASRIYVYECKGYSFEEWIIEYDPIGKSGMILRERTTTNIPEGLSSEYEWNN